MIHLRIPFTSANNTVELRTALSHEELCFSGFLILSKISSSSLKVHKSKINHLLITFSFKVATNNLIHF